MSRRVRAQPLLLALAFVVLVVVGALELWFTKRAEDAADQVERSLEVRNKLANLRLWLRRSESAQRGYVLTNDAQHLADYQADVEAVVSALDDLTAATSGNPQQKILIAALAPAINAKLEEMHEVIRLQQAGHREAALAVVRTGRGRNLMEEIATTLTRMEGVEQRLLNLRKSESDSSNRWLLLITIAGIAVIISLAATSVLLLRHALKEQQDAHSALEANNQNLEAMVAERTASLRETNEEVQRFAYIVSHDLRSPLVNIMGFTSELDAWQKQVFERIQALRTQAGADQDVESDEALRSEAQEALSFIKSSIAKMDRLIGAILKLSREGQRQFQPQFINMSQLLRSISDALAHQAQNANAEINIGELPAITSDRLGLEQVFSNLMDNALKYLRADVPGEIEVRATEARGVVTYQVRDNGRGIDPKDRERIFDLFRRSGIQDRPGEGIGLAHTRALVRRLGGSIDVESELGRGTVFKVTLPKRWSVPTSEMTR